MLEPLLIILENGLHVLLGLRLEPLELVIEVNGGLLVELGLTGHLLEGPGLFIIDQPQRDWAGEQLRELLLEMHALLDVDCDVVLYGDLRLTTGSTR